MYPLAPVCLFAAVKARSFRFARGKEEEEEEKRRGGWKRRGMTARLLPPYPFTQSRADPWR